MKACINIVSSRHNGGNAMKKKHLTIWQNNLDLNFMHKHNNRATDENGYKYKIAREIQLHNYKSVLDVGAGVGAMNNVFKNIDDSIKYTAAEITEKYIDYMESKNIDCLHFIDSIPLEDNSYDCVISFETINHQEDYKPHLHELLRVAKNKVYISFFKRFQEEARKGTEYSGRFNVYENETGLIEDRVVIDGEVVCIYNFINKNKMIEYLDFLNLDYKFSKFTDVYDSHTTENDLLTISLRDNNENV